MLRGVNARNREESVATLALAAQPVQRPVIPPPVQALAHIPGEKGLPIVGSTFAVLSDPKRFFEAAGSRYGKVIRANILGETGVTLLGPEANELVLFDQQRLFSSKLGWGRFMDRVFPRGLMMMDFDEHRLQRRVLSVAFKAGPMKGYLAA
jgi:cytochrome P450